MALTNPKYVNKQGWIVLTRTGDEEGEPDLHIRQGEIYNNALNGDYGVIGLNDDIDTLKEEAVKDITEHALSLIAPTIPALSTIEMVQFMVELWPTLNTVGASAELIYCRNVYVFSQDRISIANNADIATLQSYNPATDSWPTRNRGI